MNRESVSKIIKNVRASGAPDLSGILVHVHKEDVTLWSPILAALYTHSSLNCAVPDSWRGSIQHPIYKKGDRSEPGNHCLITLLDINAKMYASFLLKELQL